MSFESRVRAKAAELTRAQRKVAHVLLNAPADAPFLSAEQVCATAGVSLATATRLAQHLGYGGYPDLRAELQSEMRQPSAARRISGLHERAGSFALFAESELSALHDSIRSIADADLNRASELVSSAERLLVHAQGHASAVADLVERRLRRLGLAVSPLRGNARDVAERMHLARPGDVLVVVALRRQPPLYGGLVAYAEDRGVPSVVIADAIGALLAPGPTVLLAASRGRSGEHQTILVPTLIAEALCAAVTDRRSDSERRLDELDQFIADLTDDNRPRSPQ